MFFDTKIHNDNLMSFQNIGSDIKLNSTELDFIFNSLLKNTVAVYMHGFRLNFKDNNLDNYVKSISTEIYFNRNNFTNIFFDVNWANLFINRNLLSFIWEYFEYPALFFLRNKDDESTLVDLCYKNIKINEICEKISGLYVLYKSFEMNVIWINKSSDGSFDFTSQ